MGGGGGVFRVSFWNGRVGRNGGSGSRCGSRGLNGVGCEGSKVRWLCSEGAGGVFAVADQRQIYCLGMPIGAFHCVSWVHSQNGWKVYLCVWSAREGFLSQPVVGCVSVFKVDLMTVGELIYLPHQIEQVKEERG